MLWHQDSPNRAWLGLRRIEQMCKHIIQDYVQKFRGSPQRILIKISHFCNTVFTEVWYDSNMSEIPPNQATLASQERAQARGTVRTQGK